MRKTKHKYLAEGVRNQNYHLFKKNISEQDEKILMLLGLEKVASSWTLAYLSGIFITSTRRSLTNLKHDGHIKEVGTEISKTTGTRNTLYSLWSTKEEEINKWKENKKIKDEQEAEENAVLNKLKIESLKKIAGYYDNKMISDYLTK